MRNVQSVRFEAERLSVIQKQLEVRGADRKFIDAVGCAMGALLWALGEVSVPPSTPFELALEGVLMKPPRGA